MYVNLTIAQKKLLLTTSTFRTHYSELDYSLKQLPTPLRACPVLPQSELQISVHFGRDGYLLGKKSVNSSVLPLVLIYIFLIYTSIHLKVFYKL